MIHIGSPFCRNLIFLLLLFIAAAFFVLLDFDTAYAQTNDPVIASVAITPDNDAGTGGVQVNPAPNSTVAVIATITVTDANGANDITAVSVVIYKPDGITLHVPSGAAVLASATGNTAVFTYSFNMNYYDAAAVGSSYYKVVVVATDASSATGDNINSPGKFNYTESVALSLNTSLIDFGALDPGQTSTPFAVTGTNLGNVILDLSLSGASLSAGSQSIAINRVDYDQSSSFTSPLTLSTSSQTGSYGLSQGAASSKNFYFRLRVPSAAEQYIPTGTYAGTVNVSALRSSANPTAPGMTSISPASGTQGQTLSVTVNGSNFSGVTSLSFGSGVTVNSFTVNSSTQISAGITIGASADAEVRDVSVTTSGGTGTLGSAFTVVAQPPPTVTAISPASATRAQTLPVTISGTNFLGAMAVTFSGAGITVNSFVVDSATQITAVITIDAGAPANTRDVSVTTPSGTATLSNAFTVNQAAGTPVVTLVSPNSGVQGQTLSVTISGSDFTGATVVSFGTGVTVNSFNADSSTQISANITIAGAATVGARDVSVTTALGTGTLTSGFTVTAAPVAPTVTAVSPSSGVQGQIISVTVTGTDFTGATAVGFGTGVTVNSFNVDSSTQISANITIAGAATVGARDVSVTTALGTGTLTSGFTVTAVAVAPTVTSVSSASGAQGATLSVVITGTEFSAASSVSFGPGVTVNSFVIDSATQITAGITIDGAATVGVRDVSVTNPTGTGVLSGGFTIVAQPAPTVTVVNPASGARDQTLAVIITGTSFSGATSVTFSGTGITVNSFTVDSTTQITSNISIAGNAQKQPRDVLVTTPSGTGTLSAAFDVVQAPGAPTITLVSPNSGQQGATLAVTITGTDFTGTTAVDFGAGITVNSFTEDNASQITAGITISGSATAGARDVSVTTALGAGTLNAAFTVTAVTPAPTVTAVSPASGAQGATISETITGTSFTGASAVGFGAGITVNSYTVDSDTQITAGITIAGAAVTGTRDVTVTTSGGTGTLAAGFTVTQAAPTVTAVSPASGAQGATISETITGTNFTGASAVGFGAGITVNSYTVDSSTQISANITIAGAATTGTRDVTVTTPGGTGTLTAGFTVTATTPAPTVTAVSPTSGAQGATISETITGTNFTGASAVGFGAGITVNSFTVNSATQISANITIAPSATLGTRNVTVTTAGGTGTLTAGFTVTQAAPTVTAVSPTSGAQGQTLAVTVTGTSFTGASAVGFGAGITVNSYTVNSATQISANITIAGAATAGTRNVTVTTPSGTGTLTAGFTVTLGPPTVTAVSPASGAQGATISVTVTGTNFTGATSVAFGAGITVNSYTVNSATQISAGISINVSATPGTRNVSVTTSSGTGTLTAGFTVTAVGIPTVTAVSPNTGSRGQTLNITITGTNFISGATVTFSGSQITVNSVTVNSPTQITVSITIGASAPKNARDVSVTTAAGTGTLANGFNIN